MTESDADPSLAAHHPGAGPDSDPSLTHPGADPDAEWPTQLLPEIAISGYAGADPEPGADESPADPGDPVFVDSSGRRGRKLRRLGWIVGSACACYAGAVVFSLLGGNAGAPWLLIPGPDDDAKKSTAVRTPDDGGGAVTAPGDLAGPMPVAGVEDAVAGDGHGDDGSSGGGIAGHGRGVFEVPVPGVPIPGVTVPRTSGGASAPGAPAPGKGAPPPAAGGGPGQHPPGGTPAGGSTGTAPTGEPKDPGGPESDPGSGPTTGPGTEPGPGTGSGTGSEPGPGTSSGPSGSPSTGTSGSPSPPSGTESETA